MLYPVQAIVVPAYTQDKQNIKRELHGMRIFYLRREDFPEPDE
jgi:hypothetical protein